MMFYRSLVESVDMPDDQKDESIRVIFSIVCSFIDQAFGSHPVQLSLKERANTCFSGRSDYARIAHDPEEEAADLEIEGAINTQDSEGHKVP